MYIFKSLLAFFLAIQSVSSLPATQDNNVVDVDNHKDPEIGVHQQWPRQNNGIETCVTETSTIKETATVFTTVQEITTTDATTITSTLPTTEPTRTVTETKVDWTATSTVTTTTVVTISSGIATTTSTLTVTNNVLVPVQDEPIE